MSRAAIRSRDVVRFASVRQMPARARPCGGAFRNAIARVLERVLSIRNLLPSVLGSFSLSLFLLRTAAQSFFGPFAFSLSVLSMPKKPKARRCFTAGLVFTIPGFVLFRFLRAHRPRPPLFSGAPPPLRRAANDAAEGCLLHDFEDVCSKKGSFRVASRRIGCQDDSAFSPEWNSRGNERIQM